jgi:hypothetical protein
MAISLAVSGCGSDGDPAATQASCIAYCTTYIAAACAAPHYASVSACQTNECDHAAAAPASCQTAIKAYYDCRKTEADLCGNTACLWLCSG